MISDAQTSKQISELLLEAAALLDESIAVVVSSECSNLEKDRYIMAVGKVMGALGLDLLNPLFRSHPEIKPLDYYLPK